MNIIEKIARTLCCCHWPNEERWKNYQRESKAVLQTMRQLVKSDPTGCQVDDDILNGYIDRALGN